MQIGPALQRRAELISRSGSFHTMTKYQKLAEKARSAVATRRQNDADLNALITDGLPTPAEVQSGKLAEKPSAGNGTSAHETKGNESSEDTGCPVDPQSHTPPIPSNTRLEPVQRLILSTSAQAHIKSAQTQTKREKTTAANRLKRAAVPTTKWQHATPDEKFRYAGHATQRLNGLAFSLNLSGKVQQSLKSAANPIRSFTDTLNRELKRHGLSGMPYALTLEYSAADKLHVHGFLIPPDCSLSTLKGVLRAAGGKIAGRAGSTQADVREMYDGAGWAFYTKKAKDQTNDKLSGDARLFLNRAMTAAAREFSLSVSG